MIYVCRRPISFQCLSGSASLHELQCIRLMQSVASVAPRRHFLLQLQYLGFASRTKIWRKSLEHRAVLCSVQRAVMMLLSYSIDVYIYIYYMYVCNMYTWILGFSLNGLVHCWCTWCHCNTCNMNSLNSPSEAYHGERSEFQLVQFGEVSREVMEIASEGSSGGWNPSIQNSQIWRECREWKNMNRLN